jgi:hypothetical protein
MLVFFNEPLCHTDPQPRIQNIPVKGKCWIVKAMKTLMQCDYAWALCVRPLQLLYCLLKFRSQFARYNVIGLQISPVRFAIIMIRKFNHNTFKLSAPLTEVNALV